MKISEAIREGIKSFPYQNYVRLIDTKDNSCCTLGAVMVSALPKEQWPQTIEDENKELFDKINNLFPDLYEKCPQKIIECLGIPYAYEGCKLWVALILANARYTREQIASALESVGL